MKNSWLAIMAVSRAWHILSQDFTLWTRLAAPPSRCQPALSTFLLKSNPLPLHLSLCEPSLGERSTGDLEACARLVARNLERIAFLHLDMPFGRLGSFCIALGHYRGASSVSGLRVRSTASSPTCAFVEVYPVLFQAVDRTSLANNLDRLELRAVSFTLFDEFSTLRAMLGANPHLRALILEAPMLVRPRISREGLDPSATAVKLLRLERLTLSCRCSELSRALDCVEAPALIEATLSVGYELWDDFKSCLDTCTMHSDIGRITLDAASISARDVGGGTWCIQVGATAALTMRFIPSPMPPGWSSSHLFCRTPRPASSPLAIFLYTFISCDYTTSLGRLEIDGMFSGFPVQWTSLWKYFSRVSELHLAARKLSDLLEFRAALRALQDSTLLPELRALRCSTDRQLDDVFTDLRLLVGSRKQAGVAVPLVCVESTDAFGRVVAVFRVDVDAVIETSMGRARVCM